ncbi:MAG: folylpolyglutamate synthase/dihydrofolate synthase family protein [Pseudomonadota bacterium]
MAQHPDQEDLSVLLEDLFTDIAARRPSLIDLGLERVELTLSRLGMPHNAIPPAIHVAGTNGKGSTIAFLRSIIEAKGFSTHVFTSPHLVRYNERIVLAGREIDDATFIDVLKRVDDAAGEDALTFFETITCAAFLAFSEVAADFTLLETGLGGRLDATNVLSKPLATVITPIDYDHQKFLGETIEQIAGEKAGIFKPGAPAVIGVQNPDALKVLETKAAITKAVPFVHGAAWTSWPENGRLIYQDEEGLCDLGAPRLVGAHQMQNAALAVAATRAAGLSFDDTVLSAGIENAKWPARLQPLQSGPLVEILRDDEPQSEIWLDGGHNPHAAETLAVALGTLEEKSPKPLVLIAGLQANKDAIGFFRPFNGLARGVIATASEHQQALTPSAVAEAASAAGLNANAGGELFEAALLARRAVDGPARFLICGSLYLAGEVLEDNM